MSWREKVQLANRLLARGDFIDSIASATGLTAAMIIRLETLMVRQAGAERRAR